jgi:hypothetical protein
VSPKLAPVKLSRPYQSEEVRNEFIQEAKKRAEDTMKNQDDPATSGAAETKQITTAPK